MAGAGQTPVLVYQAPQQQSWIDKYPGYAFIGAILLVLLAYLLYLQIKDRIFYIIAGLGLIFLIYSWFGDLRDQKKRHTAFEVRDNIQEATHKETGLILDIDKLYIGDLWPNSSEGGVFLAYAPDIKMRYIYDTRVKFPHIRLMERDDHFTIQDFYSQHDLIMQYAKKFQNLPEAAS